ncbi:multiple PDZ domain protein-like isoform X6 [Cloeon dipterum]|uniref:multiple PDZ domain protein-like isoform X6 n=1 Tax=Cloeon dipterum TaxID=197152 RepID=UPI00321FD753
MPLNADVSTALQLLEGIQQSIQSCDDPKLEAHAAADLNLLISVLENPVFRGICTMQDALGALNNQIQAHPSLLPGDFDLDPVGHLVLKVNEANAGVMFEGRGFEPDDQRVPVAKLSVSSSSGDANSPLQVTSPSMMVLGDGIPQTPIVTPAYSLEFQKAIEAAAMGRDVHCIKLYKPEGSSLGFSVVGVNTQDQAELGIFVQEIQHSGIAGRCFREIDGRLQVQDQILAIDGQPLDADISHQQAISILQQARGLVELVIARPRPSSVLDQSSLPASLTPTSPAVARSPSATSDTSKAGSDMVLNTEWAQVEVIDLVNDGSGLGFGIIGGRSTGVVVKTILPGGVADRDARLQSGDHILQIGEVNLRGMGSEQVAAVLRQSGSHVRLVVARPVEPTSPDYQAIGSHAPIVPTKILGDAEELDRHLIQNGYGKPISSTSTMPSDLEYNRELYIYNQTHDGGEIELHPQPGTLMDVVGSQLPDISMGLLGSEDSSESLPEMDVFEVELKKDSHGLGITIAGYVCEKEELSGIFVKSISKGSAADLCRKIQVNDRIVEVDGQSLQGFNNHQAVEVLRATGQLVCLRLERYLRGPKFEQLQQAIANSEKPTTPNSPSIVSLPHVPISSAAETETIIEPDGESRTTIDSMFLHESTLGLDLNSVEASNPLVALANVEKLIDQQFDGEISPAVEDALIAKWSQIMGTEAEIVVAQLSKGEGGGLGISLEGTVDVEGGLEVRPHHYIRSILPDGPVGKNNRLKSGDELLEVNGRRLLGLNHVEVVSILKDLPLHVRMVCARKPGESARVIDTSQDRAAFVSRSILGGSLQNLIPASDRLVKAKSDGSLASSATVGTDSNSFSRMKSRSLEPLTGLAMWSSEPQVIELVKGDRGLGFSILDYQDPMNPVETVIVIRSLVPGGVAQQDGRLIPGDRLLFVNNTSLENASLDRAVQALKGASRGVVRIGVAKPLPLPDTTGGSSPTSQGLIFNDDQPLPDQDEVEVPVSNGGSATVDARSVLSSCSGDVSLGLEDQSQDPAPHSPKISKQDISQAAVEVLLSEKLQFLEQQVPNIDGISVDEEEESSLTEVEQVEAMKKMPKVVNSSDLPEVEQPLESAPAAKEPESQKEPHVEELTPVTAVEMTVRLPKAPLEPLGIAVEAEAGLFGGALVSAVLPGGAADRHGSLKTGTELLAINNENLRRVSQAQTSAILRRAALLSTEVSVTFVPAPPLVEFSPSADCHPIPFAPAAAGLPSSKTVPPQLPSVTQHQSLISPRIFPNYYRPPTVPPPPPPQPQSEEEENPSNDEERPLSRTEGALEEEQEDKTDAKECVTVISVDHGAPPPPPPPTSLPPQVPLPPPNPRPRSRSRTEILIGSDDLPRIQSVEISAPVGPAASRLPEERKPKMTITQTSAAGKPGPNMAKHWGPERLVEVPREPNTSLGISIVGGKVDLYSAGPDSGSAISGIFIKNVLPNSPAGRTGELKTGDRILEVDDVNLRTASHERAVEVIRAAGNPVRFLVQSLIQWTMDSETESLGGPSTSATPLGFREKSIPPEVPMSVTPLPELIQEGIDDLAKQGQNHVSESVGNENAAPAPSKPEAPKKAEKKYSSDESSDDEDTRDMEGRTTTKGGEEIMRSSAGNVKRTAEEIAADPEQEDIYGYTINKVKKKYGALPGTLMVAALEKGQHGLGISLAGHKDRTRMAVFVCGLNPQGTASKEGTLKVGDEILEVNGCVVQGRCHLNASAMIKGLAGPLFKVIALRRDSALGELAVKPITQFPVTLDDETIEERYAKFKNLKTVTIKKGPQGLGIMIIEGKHAEVGQGIFISDLQEGSAAEQGGITVGDMILQVNKDTLVGYNYDSAAALLKRTEGVVTLVVCSPNKKETKPGSKSSSVYFSTNSASLPSKPSHLPVTTSRSPSTPSASPLRGSISPAMATMNSRPKSPHLRNTEEPPEPPADPATCPIKPGKETTIEVNKDKMGLGLSIVGGSDTLLSAIIIHEVYPDGAAAKDGRLRPGDQILEVNTEDFRSITHTKALTVLRQTPAKVKMVVLREEAAKEEDRYDALDVELVKKPGKGLGLSIVGRKNGTGVFISDVVHGGTAEADGRLMKGDQILAVNGQDLKSASQEEAAAVLKTVAGKVNMKLGRLKPARKGGAANGTDKLEPEEPPLDRLTPPPIPPLPTASSIAAAASVATPPPPLACREVRLARGPDGLGFSIVGGHGSPHGDLPIFVKTVFESGAAATSGAIRRGDQIVAVDNVSLEGLTHHEAVAILKHATGSVVTLTIKP